MLDIIAENGLTREGGYVFNDGTRYNIGSDLQHPPDIIWSNDEYNFTISPGITTNGAYYSSHIFSLNKFDEQQNEIGDPFQFPPLWRHDDC